MCIFIYMSSELMADGGMVIINSKVIKHNMYRGRN